VPERTYPEGVPSWIDVEVPDLDAAQAFYGGLFGWTFEERTPSGSPSRYLVAHLGGGAVAGLGDTVVDSGPAWNTYVAVADVQAVAARVEAAGGKIVAGPQEVGSAGWSAECADPDGVRFRLWQAGRRRGADIVNTPGAWNFSDLHSSTDAGGFYEKVFGWEYDDVGFALMIRRPGYGDHLAATVDPGIHERQAAISTPPGFADAVGWVVSVRGGEAPHWHVTFTVEDRDVSAATAERLGGTVLGQDESAWTRDALVRDPQGATFTASQFTPPT
jgi:predicted enzyme related to lactoylglutathione lyase